MILYHFTSQYHLPHIKREGITRGDVPITPFGGFNAPWLTSDPNHETQSWNQNVLFAKDIRLTVDISDDDPNLRKWSDVIKEQVKEAEGNEEAQNSILAWFDILNDVGGGGQDHWYIYMGKIPPVQIINITYPS